MTLGEVRPGAGLSPVPPLALGLAGAVVGLEQAPELPLSATLGALLSPARARLQLCVSVYLPLGCGKVAA